MSRKINLEDLESLTNDELLYARDRSMITDEQFTELFTPETVDEHDEEAEADYSKWSAKQVKAEYDARVSAGRELAEAKNKPDAVKALEDDDAAAAAEAGA